VPENQEGKSNMAAYINNVNFHFLDNFCSLESLQLKIVREFDKERMA
jgi:hypothetical protein